MTKIKILTGSNRPGRFNTQPAQWIFNLAQKRTDISIELIDLQELALPFLDEPVTPMHRQYSKEHTFAWSKTVDDTDGFIFVTPEYNHSYAPVLKNALDYLFYEWHHKPVSFVSYGSQAGGSRAVEHLRGIAAELKMYDLREQILLPNYWENLDAQGKYSFTKEQEKSAEDLMDAIVFWAKELKASRMKLLEKTE